MATSSSGAVETLDGECDAIIVNIEKENCSIVSSSKRSCLKIPSNPRLAGEVDQCQSKRLGEFEMLISLSWRLTMVKLEVGRR
jgi:hypothetical protein